MTWSDCTYCPAGITAGFGAFYNKGRKGKGDTEGQLCLSCVPPEVRDKPDNKERSLVAESLNEIHLLKSLQVDAERLFGCLVGTSDSSQKIELVLY